MDYAGTTSRRDRSHWGFEKREPSVAVLNSRERVAARGPGTHMANPSQNIGAINSTNPTLAGTSQGNWDSMFRNRITGETPSSLAAKRANPSPVQTALDQIQADENYGGGTNPIATTLPATPSLNILAQGGPTHSDSWGASMLTGADKAAGYDTGNTQDILKKYQTPNTTAKVDYNWSDTWGA